MGKQAQRLGWRETIRQLQYGEISAVTIESETYKSTWQQQHLTGSWGGMPVVRKAFPEEAVFNLTV